MNFRVGDSSWWARQIESDLMVGAEGFEPPTLCSQSRCATRLRYAPTKFPMSDCIAGCGGGWRFRHARKLA